MVGQVGRWATRACVLAVALAACGGDSTSSDSTAPATDRPTTTTGVPLVTTGTMAPTTTAAPTTTLALPVDPGELGVLDAALASDGTIDRATALSLVAAGYGPIPGIEPAATPLVEGGPALRTVVAELAELRADQQQAIERLIAGEALPIADVADSPNARLAAAAAALDHAFSSFATTSAGTLPADTAVTLVELPYDAGNGTHHFSSPRSVATALPMGTPSEPECRIFVNASAPLDPTLGAADPVFTRSLTREAFHCLQFARVPSIAAVPAWIVDGAAAFAAEHVVGATPQSAPWWQRWITQPERPLQLRTYDAIGFFALVGETADPFAFANALLGDPSSDSVRRRVGDELLDRWGTHYATRPDWGGPFVFPSAGAAGFTAPATPVTLTVDGPSATIGGRAMTDLAAATFAFTAPGDVLMISTSPGDRGMIRFVEGEGQPLAQATQSVCLVAGGCACPGVPADSMPISSAGGADVFIGLGPSTGTGPTLTSRSMARWCQEVIVPPPPADAVEPCLVNSWSTRAYVTPAEPGVTQSVTGGDGAAVTFNPDRTVHVDTSTMTPVVIIETAADGTVTTTTLTYRGAGSGTWSAAEGVVNIANVDPTSFGIHVRTQRSDNPMTNDVDLPITDTRLASYANLLGTGRFVCTSVSLSLTHVMPGIGGTAGFELTP